MKNLYEFLEEKYEKFGDGMNLNDFMEVFISGNFGIAALSEGLLGDEVLFHYEMYYRLDHQNKKIEFVFKDVDF
ncbi:MULTISPECIES: hypothetical protein [Clostridium]|uniref:Uncharacterized protein n=1 Tax=Clostridium botulinum TaxID=1491 RepID=A0ABD7CFL9_CLOBO|nr:MULTISPECIES: hypothetical protein [Clostridium]KEI87520.1 hypothetical protein N492_11125 [Clostridium botulinum B2 267]KGO14602.1 hypothetical protein NZ45_06135 [Clostridium botulinum]KIN80190.1 hypothetical protein SD74_16750 [Clostridium botulinum]MCC5428457.1 hypothetical protein [Clostridium botulinum]NFL76762.1 hypothetical protein [Clostridium sporogenes]